MKLFGGTSPASIPQFLPPKTPRLHKKQKTKNPTIAYFLDGFDSDTVVICERVMLYLRYGKHAKPESTLFSLIQTLLVGCARKLSDKI